MIINHTHRFIFLKTKKTAGTSIEIALSQYCGPGDILTPFGWRDEPTRTKLGYQGPANYLIPRERYTRRDLFDHYIRRREVGFYNHIPAQEIVARIEPEIWNSYFKFCVERNPWDRAISAYYWQNRSKRRMPTLRRFLKKMKRRELISNFDTYAIDGKIVVDRVLRYENLAAELDEATQHLRLPGKLSLPNAKGGFRKDRRPYQEVYSAWERDYIATACAREIKEFGYTF